MEACGNIIVMAYNFMSLFRYALINSDKKPFLKNALRVDFYTGLFGKDKRQAYPLFGQVFKNKAIFPFYLGENKGFLTAL